MACTRAVERCWIYWTKDYEDGAGRQEEKKTTDEIHRCNEGDKQRICLTEENARERVRLSQTICCSDP